MESGRKGRGARDHFRLLYIALTWSGEVLLYLYFAMPFAIDEQLSLISLPIPAQAEIFGTVWPYYSLIHLAALIVACGLIACGSRGALLLNKAFTTYVAVNLIAIGAIPLLTPTGQPVYWDYAIEFLRLSSVVVLAASVLEARTYCPLILARCLLVVLAIPVIFLVISSPTNFLFERNGRVNGPGLEITSTGHIGAVTILLGLSLSLPRRYRIAMVILGSVVLGLSGARIPFALALLMASAYLWRRAQTLGSRLAIIGTIVGLAALAIALGPTSLVGGGRFSTLTGDSDALEAEYAIGRGMAFVTAMKMFAAHPLGYVDSDWTVQRELAALGFPSHTHSQYLQTYLRYGPLMFVFWGVLIARTIKGFRLKSPYALALSFFVVGSAIDYYGFVTKAMVVFFMTSALNEAHLREVDQTLSRDVARTDQIGVLQHDHKSLAGSDA